MNASRPVTRRGLGSDDFNPGVRRAQAAGLAVQAREYPGGDVGIQTSLGIMAQKIREGSVDPDVIGWAGDVLRKAGLDGRSNPSQKQQANALLEELRSATIYMPDSLGHEVIRGAAATLCLRPGLCMRGGDCFPEGTLLLRDDFELVPIEQIKVGDRIWGLDKWVAVEGKAFKGILPVDAIFLNNGSVVQLTGDHDVTIGICDRHGGREAASPCSCPWDDLRQEKIHVSEVRPGMRLPQPKRVPFGSGELDPFRAYVEGLYASDGSSSKASAFEIAGQDGCRKEQQKREVEAICNDLGIATRWSRKYVTVKDGEWTIRLQQMGAHAPEKHLLSINLGEFAAAQTLRGVMADSGVDGNGFGRTFTSTSRLLTVQTRVLHRMFGKSCGIRYVVKHGGLGTHPIWRLGVRGARDRAEKVLRVKAVERAIDETPCWDIQTEDHFVYLPEHDVTVNQCDDLTTALGSACLAAGIPVRIVHQIFDGAAQEHVLLQIQDEYGIWHYADPSTKMPLGQASQATREYYIDPTQDMQASLVTMGRAPGSSSGKLVTMGAAAKARGNGLGHNHPAHFLPFFDGQGLVRYARYAKGGWWGWSGRGWIPAPTTGTCATWSAPITPGAELGLEALRQLQASGGQPASSMYVDGRVYLYTIENNVVTVRCCTGKAGLAGVRVRARAATLGATRVAWPSLVESEIQRVNAIWQSVARDAGTCAAAGKLDANTFSDFGTQYTNWNQFAAANADLSFFQFGLGALLDQVEQYETLVYQWQQKLQAAGCEVGEPIIQPIPESDKPEFSPIFAPGSAAELQGVVTGAEKALVGVAIAGAVGVGLWFLWPVLSSARSGEKSRATAKQNPLTTGEQIALGVGAASVVGVGVYLATKAPSSTTLSPTPQTPNAPAPAPTPQAIQGHRYSITGPNGPTPITAAGLQAQLDAGSPGVFHVVSVTVGTSTTAIVVDIIGVPQAGSLGTFNGPGVTITDLGPTTSSPPQEPPPPPQEPPPPGPVPPPITPAPSGTHWNTTALVAGHRYALVTTGVTVPVVPTVPQAQTALNATLPGVATVVGVALSSQTLTITFDLLQTPPANAFAYLANNTTLNDLGPTP